MLCMQSFLELSSFRFSIFFTGSGSVVVLFDNTFFLAFLGTCSILGWIVGDNFIVWLKDEIGNWKFW